MPDIAALYAGPPEGFVKARNALVKELAQEGRDAEAAAVKTLRKPNLAAWAVNRLAHEHRPEMQELIEIWDELAAAPDAKTVAKLSSRRKKLVGKLLELAGKELERQGHASASTMEKVARTLNSGVAGEERERLLEGRLERELEPAGFAAWTGEGLPEPSSAAEEREIERAEAEASDAREELERAQRSRAQAEDALARAEATLEAARRKEDEAGRVLEEAEARVEELRARLPG